jgi:hypothetical protein
MSCGRRRAFVNIFGFGKVKEAIEAEQRDIDSRWASIRDIVDILGDLVC